MSVETESTSWKNTSKKSNKKHDRKAKASDNMSGDKSEKKADHSAHSAATDKSANARSEPLPENVKAVMDLTLKSEDEVVMALHVADGDLDRAVNDLLEGVSPEWEIKKKSSPSRRCKTDQRRRSSGQSYWQRLQAPVSG
ncbi:unnamed protein product [Trichogramma brassicae]|uniref:UBA domain-containing protein n=1 Tax=Trichogramma brassicae TaxID=86971 RepID=A0A6H5IDU9_9HYME|nr:unnamed protein product [Trichogramma brassicae]